jgi:glutathione S-transferase
VTASAFKGFIQRLSQRGISVVLLVRFGPGWQGFVCVSQFVLKVETYLRMAGIDYQVRDAGLNFADNAPKGKLPYIEHQGRVVADSGIIIDYLEDKFGNPLDAHISESHRATSPMLKRMVEEHLWWVMNRERWWAPENPYRHTVGMFDGLTQKEYEEFRDESRRKCMEQGVGAFTEAEIDQRGAADLEAMSLFLGQQAFFLGERPTSLDATTYAFLFQILHAPYTSNLKVAAQSHPNLVDYVERISNTWFPEVLVS